MATWRPDHLILAWTQELGEGSGKPHNMFFAPFLDYLPDFRLNGSHSKQTGLKLWTLSARACNRHFEGQVVQIISMMVLKPGE